MSARDVHECPGCKRDDVPAHMYACPDCMDRLPLGLRSLVTHPSAETVYALARAQLWFSNVRPR